MAINAPIAIKVPKGTGAFPDFFINIIKGASNAAPMINERKNASAAFPIPRKIPIRKANFISPPPMASLRKTSEPKNEIIVNRANPNNPPATESKHERQHGSEGSAGKNDWTQNPENCFEHIKRPAENAKTAAGNITESRISQWSRSIRNTTASMQKKANQ